VDKHTLDKLEFDHIRQLLARQAQCALGREMALRISPSRRALHPFSARGLGPVANLSDDSLRTRDLRGAGDCQWSG
jgi:hypothetical protein